MVWEQKSDIIVMILKYSPTRLKCVILGRKKHSANPETIVQRDKRKAGREYVTMETKTQD